MFPAGLLSSFARELITLLIEGNTLKMGNIDDNAINTHLSSRPSGFNSGTGSNNASGSASGSGSNNASASGSGPGVRPSESPEELRVRTSRELAQEHERYHRDLAVRNQAQAQAQAQGRAFLRDNNPQRARVIQAADVATHMPDILERQRLQEAEQARLRQITIANYARENAGRLQAFANSPGDIGFLVPDPQGIGARGYIHRGINQPYARDLAAELRNQDVAGKLFQPRLDNNAKRFLAGALPHIRPEVYGPNPSAVNNASMVVQNTIRQLERMN